MSLLVFVDLAMIDVALAKSMPTNVHANMAISDAKWSAVLVAMGVFVGLGAIIFPNDETKKDK